MAIVNMSKFSLLSFKNEKNQLLDVLQRFQKVQFINLQENEDEDLSFFSKDSDKIKVSEIEEILSKVNFSLDFLNKYVPKVGGLKALKDGQKTISFDEFEEIGSSTPWEEYYEILKGKETELSNIKNEKAKLKSEIDILMPWRKLDCSFKELHSLDTVKTFIGFIPKVSKESFIQEFTDSFNESFLEFVSEVKTDISLVVMVSKSSAVECEKMLKKFGFSSFATANDGIPSNSISSKEKLSEELLKKEATLTKEISLYAEKREELEIVHQYYSALHNKSSASDNFLKSTNILAVEGWIPTELESQLEDKIKLVCNENYYLHFVEAQKEDPEVPIQLKNNKIVKAFESITEMYSLPLYSETDPTSGLTFFYLIFFGMMLGDVGYGLVLFLGTLIALNVLNLNEKTKDFLRFFFLLSIPTMMVGVIYGGFFGDFMRNTFPNIRLLKGFVDPGTDVVGVLLVSILFGAIHIFFGLGVKAYNYIKDGKFLDVIYDVVSMYLTILGAGGLIVSMAVTGMPSFVATISKYAMILGMLIILFTGGREMESVGGKLGQGLYSLYGLTGYVGDLISYSRLMALGLAGGFVANAFNLMITLIPPGIARIIGGILIFVIGHIFNLFISALGAYVHTCRLQYVEYFGKFYEGGGKPYTPFKSENNFVNIKDN